MQEAHNFAVEESAPAEADGASRAVGLLGIASPYVAHLAAWIATCGSLFFSLGLGWPPCDLCWYQRILMYPLALIIPVGILRRDRRMHHYVLPLSLLGVGTSLYHYLLTKTNLFPPPPCSNGIPCTVDYLDWFGFINIPFMALTAFLIITVAIGATALGADDAEAADVAEGEAEAPLWPWIAVVGIAVVVASTFIIAGTLV